MTVQEVRTVSKIAEDYQRRGYVVTVAPQTASMPFYLGNCRPDILAVKGRERLLIDVKLEGVRDVGACLRLAKEVQKKTGWRLLFATVPAVDTLENSAIDARGMDVDGLRARLGDIDASPWEDRSAPLILTRLWVAYVAALRMFALQQGVEGSGDTDFDRLNMAYANGLISIEEYEAARALMALRDQAAHRSGIPVSADDCRQLRLMVQALIARIAPVHAMAAVEPAGASCAGTPQVISAGP